MKFQLLFLLLIAFISTSVAQNPSNFIDSKGLKQGKWVASYPSGTLRYEGSFADNKPVGTWKRYHENGKVKAILSYRIGSEKVAATLFDEEGKMVAKGIFIGEKRDSVWTFFNADKMVRIETYVAGKLNGSSVTFDQGGGVLSEKNWRSGLQDGISKEYYPAGTQKSLINYSEGKREGLATFYDESGAKTLEGKYQNDLSEGDWISFDKDGKVKYRISYSKGNVLNSGKLDTLQINEFKRYDRLKGQIPEPRLDENGMPVRR